MVYRFTIVSDEVDGFMREIQIDSDATFYDLHLAVAENVGYSTKEMASFIICDDDWEKEKEVTLEDMGSSSEEDVYLMRDTTLSDILEDEKQKLRYVFDYMTERSLFIELSEIIIGKDLKTAQCTKSEGEAPKQTMDLDEMAPKTTPIGDDLGENFYGDESFNDEDFDLDSFEVEDSNEKT